MMETTGTRTAKVTTFSCGVCGEAQGFTDLRAGDRVDHRCGWHGSGSTWWMHREVRRRSTA